MTKYQQGKISAIYIYTTAAAVIFSWLLHEIAHWIAGKMLGYNMGMTLNKTFPVSGGYKTNVHYQLISAAGPVITIIQAFICFLLLKQKGKPLLYPFLFTCCYIRLLAAVLSISNPNDEARISSWAGIGKFTLPLIVSALLFWLVYQTSVRRNYSLRFNLITLFLVILFSSAIILADQFLKIRLL